MELLLDKNYVFKVGQELLIPARVAPHKEALSAFCIITEIKSDVILVDASIDWPRETQLKAVIRYYEGFGWLWSKK